MAERHLSGTVLLQPVFRLELLLAIDLDASARPSSYKPS